MASLNLAGKTSGYVKLQAPDDSSNNPTVTLPTESGELALKSDIGEGGGGTGGGDYTPEKMVWSEDLSFGAGTKERHYNNEYVNDTDVPRYVQIYTISEQEGSNSSFYIDDFMVGKVGCRANQKDVLNNPLYIVPAGSKYKLLSSEKEPVLSRWYEARMPVAVGTGGKTVAFRGELSAAQTGLPTSTPTKINLDVASIDTDNALTDGKFQPSVAGYYQVNGSVTQNCFPASSQTSAFIYKNGNEEVRGSTIKVEADTGVDGSLSSTASDVIYLNGTTDYVELYGTLTSTGSCDIQSGSVYTYLSAVLVSGGSASGDSIWTEEDGKAVYDGVVKSTSHFNTNGDGTAGGIHFKDGDVLISRIDNDMVLKADGADRMKLTANGVTTYQDMTVNGVTVGLGGGNKPSQLTVGRDALKAITTGFSNIAIGHESQLSNTEGLYNLAVGHEALKWNITGVKNTAVGTGALQETLGSNNTAIGTNAGKELTTGSGNIVIGNEAQASSPEVSNEVTIGNADVTKTRLKGEVSIVDNIISSSNLQFNTDGTSRMTIANDGKVVLPGKMEVLSDGVVNFSNIGNGNGFSKYRFNGSNDPYLEAGTVGGVFINSDPSKLDAYPLVTNKDTADKAYHVAFKNINGICGTIWTQGTSSGLEGISTRASDVMLSDDFTGRTLKEELAIKDKLIEKLSDRLDKLEKKLKK